MTVRNKNKKVETLFLNNNLQQLSWTFFFHCNLAGHRCASSPVVDKGHLSIILNRRRARTDIEVAMRASLIRQSSAYGYRELAVIIIC